MMSSSSRVVNRSGRSTPVSSSQTNTSQSQSASRVPNEEPITRQEEGGEEIEYIRCLLIVMSIFCGYMICFACLYCEFPELQPKEKKHMKLPTSFHDAKVIGNILQKYTHSHFFLVFIGFCQTFVFLQTFAVPGTMFLSLLAGFLFDFWIALPMVCVCSAVGAMNCYCVSWLIGKPFFMKFFPTQISEWEKTMDNHRDEILHYIIFLRMTPFVPNWFVNVVSPVIGVPIMPFFFGTLIGVSAPSFVYVHAGVTLNMLSDTSEALGWGSICMLGLLGLLSLLPVWAKWYSNRYDRQ